MERETRTTLSVCGVAEVKQSKTYMLSRDSRPGQGYERDPGLEATGKQLLLWRCTHREGLDVAGLGGACLISKRVTIRMHRRMKWYDLG